MRLGRQVPRILDPWTPSPARSRTRRRGEPLASELWSVRNAVEPGELGDPVAFAGEDRILRAPPSGPAERPWWGTAGVPVLQAEPPGGVLGEHPDQRPVPTQLVLADEAAGGRQEHPRGWAAPWCARSASPGRDPHGGVGRVLTVRPAPVHGHRDSVLGVRG